MTIDPKFVKFVGTLSPQQVVDLGEMVLSPLDRAKTEKFAGSLTGEQMAAYVDLITSRLRRSDQGSNEKPATTEQNVVAAPNATDGVDFCDDCGGQIAEVGDVAWLASGGPALTIIAINEEKAEADVCWFDPKDSVFVYNTFPLAALVSSDPDADE